eukprot:m.118067 g.118067  ORF g.118067 m.118067 type:complete len:462 (+) comp13221_c0_seq4:2876-4261(+)
MDLTYPSFEGLRRYPSASDVPQADAEGTGGEPRVRSPRMHDIKRTKAVIIVGGPKDGTRFRPLSLNHPKPLFPIAGVPMVHHHLEACAKLPGMTEIIMLGVFPESQVSDFAAAASQRLGIPVKYLREFEPLGTAGGLYFFRDLIMTHSPDALLVIHADICADIPIVDLIDFHASVNEAGNHLTVMSTPARKDMAKNYGCLISDADTFEVSHYVEKPQSYVSSDINCGVYIFSPAIFDDMRNVFVTKHENKDPHPQILWLERDVLTNMAGTGRLFMYKTENFWSQVKTASSAIYANRHYLETYRRLHPESLHSLARNTEGGPTITGDVWIHSSADIHPTAKLGPNVSIGINTKIGPGARIKDSIILDRVVVGSHSLVTNSIVDDGCAIGEWARVEGAPVGPNPNDPTTAVQPKELFTTKGTLEPSTTIIGTDSKIEDEVLVLNVICLPHKDITGDCKNQIIL